MSTPGSRIPPRLRIARAAGAASLGVGASLLALMVIIEGEPGLLPLVLVLVGALGLGIAHARIARIARSRRADG